jgi:hypothetical protein
MTTPIDSGFSAKCTKCLAAFAATLNLTTSVLADEAPSATGRADSHAPIGVMGDHTHNKGEWMFSYRYMRMDMSGNLSGTGSMSTAEVLQDFMVAPTDMKSEMHMVGLMYAPSDRVTLMAMLPWHRKSMNHVTRMGGQFETRTSGMGDAKLDSMIRLFYNHDANAHLTVGVSMPTGDIDETGMTPMGDVRLPYPMQNGSGTWDLRLAGTYNGRNDNWSWGGQAGGVIRTGKSSNDYRLGDEAFATAWLARRFDGALSLSARLEYRNWGNIKGADPKLNPRLVPTADPQLRGGKRLDLAIGINLLGMQGVLKDHRLALEWIKPLYQNLDGPQLNNDWMAMLGYQKAF